IKEARLPAIRRLPPCLDILESLVLPAIDMFFSPLAVVVALNPQLPPAPVVQFDPLPVPSQTVDPGPPTVSDTPVHFDGPFGEVVANPIFMQMNYVLDGVVHITVTPQGQNGAGSMTASWRVAGMCTGFVQAASNPLW